MADVENTYWLKDGLDGRQEDDGVIMQNESCIIQFDSEVATVNQAIEDSGFKIGQEHRTEVFMFLQGPINAEIVEEDNATSWRFDLTYTSEGYNNSNSGDDSDYRPQVELGSWSYMQVVETDKETGEAILNTAGEPYNPAPETQVSAPVVRVTIKENSANIQRVESIGSINNAQIRICGITFPKYCAMLANYETRPFYDEENFLTFYNTFTIKGKFYKNVDGRPIGFKQESVSRGFNQLVDGKLSYITVQDPEDEDSVIPTSEPLLLDEDGAVTSIPYYEYWVIDDMVNFSLFGLPSNYPVY